MRTEHEIVTMSDPELPIKATLNSESIEPLASRYHLHEEVELIAVLEGVMSFQIRGSTMPVSAGEILLINSREAHASRVVGSGETRICLLQFEPRVAYNARFLSEFKYLSPFMGNLDIPYRKLAQHDLMEIDTIRHLMIAIAEEFRDKPLAYEISIKSSLYRILTLLYRSRVIPFEGTEGMQRKNGMLTRMQKVLLHVERHYAEPIAVEDACSLVEMNYHYFCRSFRSVTGSSFNQYLNRFRISMAEKLLLTTERSITDICGETGFSSISYFNRVFRKEKGMSPSAYRRMASPV
jgi:AraC-like DNA-binding protein